MSAIDDRSDAAGMITELGQTVTIAGTASTTYNPATGAPTTVAYSATVNGVLLPLSPYRMEKDSNIVAGDERMILAAIDTSGKTVSKPPLDSLITLADGSTKYTVIAVDPLHPAGTDLLFDCVVRGRK